MTPSIGGNRGPLRGKRLDLLLDERLLLVEVVVDEPADSLPESRPGLAGAETVFSASIKRERRSKWAPESWASTLIRDGSPP